MITFLSDCSGLFTDTFNAAMGQELFVVLRPSSLSVSALPFSSCSTVEHRECNTKVDAGELDPHELQLLGVLQIGKP